MLVVKKESAKIESDRGFLGLEEFIRVPVKELLELGCTSGCIFRSQQFNPEIVYRMTSWR